MTRAIRLRLHLGVALLALLQAAAAAAQVPPCGGAEAEYCSEVRRLLSRPEVRAAFDEVVGGRERAHRDLLDLTQIPAPPFGEEARGRAFAALLRAAGADSVFVDSVGNVIALRRGERGGRTAVLGGHLDTAFPAGTDVTVRQRGDTLFAPGIGDDTRGLVVVLEALRALEAAKISTGADVLFVGTVGEEGLGDLRGAKYLFRAGGPRIDAYIGIDGGSDAEITHQALGSVRYRVHFRGPGGHSWGAFGTANPIHAAGRGVALFAEAAGAAIAGGPRTSFNVGRIGGGTSINSIPSDAWFETDMRSESPEALQHVDSIFHASMLRALAEENRSATRGDSLVIELERAGERPSGETPTSAALFQRALAATALLGHPPELDRSSTDANVPISRGIPALTIGRGGDGGNSHAPEEWWRDVDSHVAVQRALLILLAEAGLD
ncbi:MAG: M20/M25/M40 family metallo-hydrolase [Gemmatimonadetes bacterium]|nr:M20/M25/M40 family metallo-hydrolase [Gemmatimonadota bacterium]